MLGNILLMEGNQLIVILMEMSNFYNFCLNLDMPDLQGLLKFSLKTSPPAKFVALIHFQVFHQTPAKFMLKTHKTISSKNKKLQANNQFSNGKLHLHDFHRKTIYEKNRTNESQIEAKCLNQTEFSKLNH